jgi:hypothetical protein
MLVGVEARTTRGAMTTSESRLEPCYDCGRETAAGTPLHPERRIVPSRSGGYAFLCGECAQLADGDRGGRAQTTDEERLTLERTDRR